MPTSAFLIQDVPEGKVGKDMGNATRSPGVRVLAGWAPSENRKR